MYLSFLTTVHVHLQVETDHVDAEISEILFKDYWELIKDREHLTLQEGATKAKRQIL